MSTISQVHDSEDELFADYGSGLTEADRTEVRAEEIHARLLHNAQVYWTLLVKVVLGFYHLRSITIDVNKFFCPSGCCRLEMFRSYPFRRLLVWFTCNKGLLVHEPKVFFVGLRNRKESWFLYKKCGFKKWALDTYEMDGRDVEIDVTRQHPIEEEYSDASEASTDTEDE